MPLLLLKWVEMSDQIEPFVKLFVPIIFGLTISFDLRTIF